MLIPDEPAGRIATRSAGTALFDAEFTTRPGDPPQEGSAVCMPPFGPAPPGTRFLLRASGMRAPSPTRRFCCEIRFLSDVALRHAADRLLREASALAGLEEAIFEARMLRLVEPVVHPVREVESLAWDLWHGGFPVRFGPSWSPGAEGSVAVGSGGMEAEMAAFVRGHPFWGEARFPAEQERAG